MSTHKKDTHIVNDHKKHMVLACTFKKITVILNTLSNYANKGASWWLIIALGLMSILIGAQVFCRYILNNSLFWSEEVGRILLVQITFLGASIAFKNGVHPSIRTFTDFLSPKNQMRVHLFTLVIALGFFTILAWYGAHFAVFISKQITPSLGISKSITVAIIPIASTIAALHAMAGIVSIISKKTLLNQDNIQFRNKDTHINFKAPKEGTSS